MRRLLYDTKLPTLTTNKQAAAWEQNECVAQRKLLWRPQWPLPRSSHWRHACSSARGDGPRFCGLGSRPARTPSTGQGPGAPSHRPLASCPLQRVSLVPSPSSTRESTLLASAAFDCLAFFRRQIYRNKDCLFLCALRASGTNYESGF